MALITCPECKKRISESADDCPKCGYKLSPEKIAQVKKRERQAKRSNAGCLIVVGIVAVLYFAGVFSSEEPASKRRSRSSSPRESSPPREVVRSSGWDGSVSQVKSWLKANLKDPGSLEFIEWSPVQRTDDGGFMVRAKYRAKNGFGGYGVENKMFFLDSAGNVTKLIDYYP